MIGFIVKIFVCPITVMIASLIFPNVYYANVMQAIFGALLTALLLTFTEVIQHNWLIKSGRTAKSPT